MLGLVIMDKQTIDLGTILKSFPKFKFSMKTFDDRLRLQKFVYLLQSFDVFLGYHYSWYLRGPYCSTLTTCGFALEAIYDKTPEDNKVIFTDSGVRDRFEKFRKFVTHHEMDNDFLEIAASIHLLHKIGNYTDDIIIKKVTSKQERFTEEQVKKVQMELEKCDLLE